MKTILVFGKTGQLAQALNRASRDKPYLMNFVDRAYCDLSGPVENIKNIFDETTMPDAVIIAAAFTAVDDAEKDKKTSFKVNAHAPEEIAKICYDNDIPLVYISTDYVFDGQGTSPYLHTHPTKPINVYGASKLAGEKAVSLMGERTAIIRTSWVYDGFGKNFMTTILRLAQKRDTLLVVADQIGRPTYTGHLAQSTLTITERLMAATHKNSAGIFHVTGSGCPISWAQFASTIFEETRNFLPHPMTVHPIPTREYPTPAKRPKYSVLELNRYETLTHGTLPHWKDGLRLAVEEYKTTMEVK